jgi:putative FmdB family regulatory protein
MVDTRGENGIMHGYRLECGKEGYAMPTYDFKCEKCSKKFSLLISVSEHDKKGFRCPKCKSTKVRQQITSFQVNTTKKS